MKYTIDELYSKELKCNCENCFGLCCTALFFSACDGFPQNKDAGKPCINLKQDFTCSIHNTLLKKGLKGCISYECFGAGQKIAQKTFNKISWRKDPQSASKMFDTFLIIRQIHEMLWYLVQSYTLEKNNKISSQIESLIDDTIKVSLWDVDKLLNLNLESYRDKVNVYLKATSETIRKKFKISSSKSLSTSKKQIQGKNFLGKDLTKYNLCGADFRGALLIASNLSYSDLSGADFIGADLRDTGLSSSDLSRSIFLTQA
ncbi:pentapeptide repeats family protein (plasmid) [Clostridium butyricum]|nr:pentapeptide repeats family protein [Clostridium butyricum]